MSMKKVLMVLLVCFLVPFLLTAQKIQVVTEEYAPFNFTEKGKLTGFSTEVVQEVLNELRMDVEMKSLEWSHAYKKALEEPNVLIFTIARTEEREELFKWVGTLAHIEYYFYSLKSRKDIVLNGLEDAKKYRTGVVLDDVREQLLLQYGFERQNQLDPVAEDELNMKKLFSKRIDLWVNTDINIAHLAALNGYNTRKLEKKLMLSSMDLYMAFGAVTSDVVVKQFSDALERVKKSSRYKKIQNKYVK